jgi:hypothetical protein
MALTLKFEGLEKLFLFRDLRISLRTFEKGGKKVLLNT